MRVLLLNLICFLLLQQGLPAQATDPFAAIERIELDNGIVVYLAPNENAKLFKAKVIVDVGWVAETKDNWGVSHLLEHVLFRDKRLPDEMSYLQLIKEKGGETNGVTDRRATSYFATIPYKKQKWLFNKMFQMLTQQEEFLEQHVEKEKETVLREIGEPSKISLALNFDAWKFIKFDYLKLPDIWRTQFDVNYDDPFTREQERLSTLRLTQAQIAKHYQEYYHPENINLFFTGNFKKTELLENISNTWAELPKRVGLKIAPRQNPKPKKIPYYRVAVTANDPYISIGTKYWDLSLKDEIVIETYLKHLAHRLMKEVRNKFGYTYDVSPYMSFYNRFGYSAIEFNTKEEHYKRYKDLLENYITTEAEAGSLPTELIEEAKKLELNEYEVSSNDVHSLMAYSEVFHDNVKTYKDKTSPYAILQNLTPEEFNSVLKKYFKKEQRYTYLQETTYFFTWDYLLISLLVFAFCYRRFRLYLTKPFNHTQLRWSRKIQYTPLYILQITLTIIAFMAFAHIQFALSWVLNSIALFGRSLFFGYYVQWAMYGSLVALVLQSVYACVPRKLILAGQHLYIKSLTYYSKQLDSFDIESIRTVSLFTILKTPKLWFSIGWRFYYFDFFFWREAMFIKLKTGQVYLFSFRHAEKAVSELNLLLSNNLSQQVEAPNTNSIANESFDSTAS